VASVRERVDPRLLGCEAKQRLDVVDVRVHAAVRHEAEKVDALAALERGDERRVLEEGTVGNCPVDAHEVLEEDAAGPDREVADFGVAHLSVREAYGLTGRGERRVRKLAPEAVEVRRAGELDGVAGTGRSAAPTVEDDQRN